MGGHGGLNILPQKSWNVYGRENRLKVVRDEAKAAAEEQAQRDKHVQAERDYRHQLLLHKARQTSEAADSSTPASQALVAQPGGALLQHINFWVEDELKLANPEAEADKRKERRARGDPDTQTSDARFDERFQLAHGLTGAAAQPWYARAGSSLPAPEAATCQPDAGQALQLGSQPPGQLARDGSCPAGTALLGAKDKQHRKLKKDKRDKKEKSRDKRRSGVAKAGGGKSVAELREERRVREEAERARQRRVIMGVAASQVQADRSRPFNSAFGVGLGKRR